MLIFRFFFYYTLQCSHFTFFIYCPLLQHLSWTLHFASCLFKTRLPESLVCSDWSALTCLSRQLLLCWGPGWGPDSSFEDRLCKSQWTEQFDTSTAFIYHINLLDKQRDTEIFICTIRDVKWLSDNLSDSCFPSALCPLFFSCQFDTVKRCRQPALTLTPGRQLIVTRSRVQHSLTADNFKVLGAKIHGSL